MGAKFSVMNDKKILVPSSRPDINEDDIARVVETLRSGWITTGPRVREFEAALAAWLDVPYTLCLNSATAGMELILRVLGIGPGDEVITTAYTYAATANIIRHLGARAVLVDTLPDDFAIDPKAVAAAMGPRTKAIIPVDFAGWPCEYAALAAAAEDARAGFAPANPWQEAFGRPIILADAAHSLGSRYGGKRVSRYCDFAVYSFHAVKNLTTAEGGAIAFRGFPFGQTLAPAHASAAADEFARQLRLMALHGQTKDALAKEQAGSWEYDIEVCGYKHNMTDMQAALGIGQLARYELNLARRKAIAEMYVEGLRDARFIPPLWAQPSGTPAKKGEPETGTGSGLALADRPPWLARDALHPGSRGEGFPPRTQNSIARETSYHLYPLRLAGYSLEKRNALIARLADAGIAANVHYKPLPLFTAYKDEYRMEDFPNAYAHYVHEITLPLWPGMSEEQIDWVIAKLIELA
jgi:dTDP-4-amino-4,6-dideoxygalactose transaminase